MAQESSGDLEAFFKQRSTRPMKDLDEYLLDRMTILGSGLNKFYSGKLDAADKFTLCEEALDVPICLAWKVICGFRLETKLKKGTKDEALRIYSEYMTKCKKGKALDYLPGILRFEKRYVFISRRSNLLEFSMEQLISWAFLFVRANFRAFPPNR